MLFGFLQQITTHIIYTLIIIPITSNNYLSTKQSATKKKNGNVNVTIYVTYS